MRPRDISESLEPEERREMACGNETEKNKPLKEAEDHRQDRRTGDQTHQRI